MNKYGIWHPPDDFEVMHPRIEYRDARDVSILDSLPRGIGILNQDGEMLYRFPNEIGFGRN